MMKLFHKKDAQSPSAPVSDRDLFWSLNRHGNVVFSASDDLIKTAYQPDTGFEHPAASFLIMILCGMLDILMFTQLFSAILYDSFFFRVAATLVLFVGFDFGPVYLGLQFRRDRDGMAVNRMVMSIFVIAFALAFASSAYLRFYARDIILPADSFSGSAEVNPLAVPWAVFGTVAPLITSLVSFAISYFNYRPLMARKKALETSIARVQAEIMQHHSILCEYDEEQDLSTHLALTEEGRYLQAVAAAKNQGIYLCNYVRERLKEHLGEPSSTNELSKSAALKLLNELETVSTAVREMCPPDEPAPLPEESSGRLPVRISAA